MVYRAALIPVTLTAALGVATELPTLTIQLEPLHSSAEHGTATLAQRGSDLIVTVAMTGLAPGAPPQFAHLHKGTCEHIASPSVYALEPLRDGRSTSRLINVGFETLIHGTYSIVVHKTLSHSSPHVACGTIAGA